MTAPSNNVAAGDLDESTFTFQVGTSVLTEFALGHTPADVLRELIQNEYDAGGDRIVIRFTADALTVAGSGAPIDDSGWRRLSVMLGTGEVAGTGVPVQAKVNGIGSKNFGVRSLFLFGDQIFVSSSGRRTVLDRRLGAFPGPVPDPDSVGTRGVRLRVPYRPEAADRLQAFDLERERQVLADIAAGLAPALLKLAVPGSDRSVRHVAVESERLESGLEWRQTARVLPGRARAIRRSISVRNTGTVPLDVPGRFDEVEFQRTLVPPPQLRGTARPAYFKRKAGRVLLGVSVPVKGRRLTLDADGSFYYPLGAPRSGTGFPFSVNGPFEMTEDRGRIVDPQSSPWNAWLVDEVARFAVELLPTLYAQFGPDAYRLVGAGPSPATSVLELAVAVADRLKTEPAWPSADTVRGADPFDRASRLAVGTDRALQELLVNVWNSERVLAPSLASDPGLRHAATTAGAMPFTVSSLVRLRCAGAATTGLRTKLGRDESPLTFTDFPSALTEPHNQTQMAAALDASRTRLTADHRADLAGTPTTLTAAGTLAAAATLWVLPEGVEATVPAHTVLHPQLAVTKVIPTLGRTFNLSKWAQDLATSAQAGTATDAELDALGATLRTGPKLSAAAWAALRRAPVLRDTEGRWVAPADAVSRAAAGLRYVQLAVSTLTVQDEADKTLAPLKPRPKLRPDDLVALARFVEAGQVSPDAFIAAATKLPALLTPTATARIRTLRCLHDTTGRLVAPQHAYAASSRVTAVLDDTASLVDTASTTLLAKLGCRTEPTVDDITERLRRRSSAGEALPQRELVYRALADAARRERFSLKTLAEDAILWTGGAWVAPDHCVTGREWRPTFVVTDAVPVLTGPPQDVHALLGAHVKPTVAHWRRLLESVAARHGHAPRVPRPIAQALTKAYTTLPGPPEGLADTVPYLLDDTGRLHPPTRAANGRLLINDDPALAAALIDEGRDVSFVEHGDPRSVAFWRAASVRSLTAAARPDALRIGTPSTPPVPVEPMLSRLHDAQFASAAAALASALLDTSGLARKSVRNRLLHVQAIDTVTTLHRGYRLPRVGTVEIAVDFGIERDRIVVVRTSTAHEFRLTVARAVAAAIDAAPRSGQLLSDPIYFLMRCSTPTDLQRELARRKVAWKPDRDFAWATLDDDDDADDEETSLAEALTNAVLHGSRTRKPTTPDPPADDDHEEPTEPPPPQPRPPLPDLSDVQPRFGSTAPPADKTKGGGGGGRSNWTPRNQQQRDEDDELGRRGEQIVLGLERDRIAALGRPPTDVIWVAHTSASADHDLRSVDDDGGPLYIEVKATRGGDGQFSWPDAEFRLAIEQGDRYVLYRVYEADSTTPIVVPFRNPVRLFQQGKMRLDLKTLKADVGGVP